MGYGVKLQTRLAWEFQTVTTTQRNSEQHGLQTMKPNWFVIGKHRSAWWDLTTSSYLGTTRSGRGVHTWLNSENGRYQPTSSIMHVYITNLWFNPRRQSELHTDPQRQKSLVARETCYSRDRMWSWESRHESNSLTGGVHLTKGLGNTDNSARWYDYQSR